MQEGALPLSRAKDGRTVPLCRTGPHLVLVDDELRRTTAHVSLRRKGWWGERRERTPSSPTGPRACVLPVETPTSVPNPYLNPSAKRVLALTYTPAESIPRENARALSSDSVTMQSVWWDECELMWAMAAAQEGTALTARVRSRNSVE